MPDYLVSELTGVIDTAVNSRITINHGLYTTPDIVTAYVVDSALKEYRAEVGGSPGATVIIRAARLTVQS